MFRFKTPIVAILLGVSLIPQTLAANTEAPDANTNLSVTIPIGYKNSTPSIPTFNRTCRELTWTVMPIINLPSQFLHNGYYKIELSTFADFNEIAFSSEWTQALNYTIPFDLGANTHYFRLKARPDLVSAEQISRYSPTISCTLTQGNAGDGGPSIFTRVIQTITNPFRNSSINTPPPSPSSSDSSSSSFQISTPQKATQLISSINNLPPAESHKILEKILQKKEISNTDTQDMLIVDTSPIKLSGTAEGWSFAIIEAEINSSPIEKLTTTADKKGTWSIESTSELETGFHFIQIKATNPKNPSEQLIALPQILYAAPKGTDISSAKELFTKLNTELIQNKAQILAYGELKTTPKSQVIANKTTGVQNGKKELFLYAKPITSLQVYEEGIQSITTVQIRAKNLPIPMPLEIIGSYKNPQGETFQVIKILHSYMQEEEIEIPFILKELTQGGKYTITLSTKHKDLAASTSFSFFLLAVETKEEALSIKNKLEESKENKKMNLVEIESIMTFEESTTENRVAESTLQKDQLLNITKNLLKYNPENELKTYFSKAPEELINQIINPTTNKSIEKSFFYIPNGSIMLSNTLQLPAPISFSAHQGNKTGKTYQTLQLTTAFDKIQKKEELINALNETDTGILIPQVQLLDTTFTLHIPLSEQTKYSNSQIYKLNQENMFMPVARAYINTNNTTTFRGDSGGLFVVANPNTIKNAAFWKPLSPPPNQNSIFTDIKPEWEWSTHYINKLYNYNIVQGKTANTFAPQDFISRAELTKIALNAFGYTTSFNTIDADLSDLKSEDWSTPYMIRALQGGFVKGYENGTIKPNNAINRAEAITILLRAMGISAHSETKTKVPFADVPKNAWYYNTIAYAWKNNIVHGYANGTFGPDKKITRAAVAKITQNLLNFEEALFSLAE